MLSKVSYNELMNGGDKTMTLLTRKELANALKVSEMTISRMDSNSEIPSIKIGKQYRYKLDDVVKALNNG